MLKRHVRAVVMLYIAHQFVLGLPDLAQALVLLNKLLVVGIRFWLCLSRTVGRLGKMELSAQSSLPALLIQLILFAEED